jgi:hypothetical protein
MIRSGFQYWLYHFQAWQASFLHYFLKIFYYIFSLFTFKMLSPFLVSPPKIPCPFPLPPASMRVFPYPPTLASLPWHSPTLGHPAFPGPMASLPIDVQQGHPLLHMWLKEWVPPYVLFGSWFSPWELWRVWLVDIVVPPMGLQTPSVPSVLSLTPTLGTLCLVQWLAASIHLCICQALAEPLRRQLYQAPVSKYFLPSTIVSGFGDCIWDGSPGGESLWMAFPWVFAPHFVSVFPPVGILFPLLRRPKHSYFGLPSFWTSGGLWIVAWGFQISGLISTYRWAHTMCVLLWMVTAIKMIFSSYIHLPKIFMNPLFVIAE